MKVLDCAQLPNAIRSIAVSPSGDRVAVATGPGEWLDDTPSGETDGSTEEAAAGDQTLHLFRIRKKGLVAERTVVLHGAADATDEPPRTAPYTRARGSPSEMTERRSWREWWSAVHRNGLGRLRCSRSISRRASSTAGVSTSHPPPTFPD